MKYWGISFGMSVCQRGRKYPARCTGYLGHPCKNKPFESEKELLSLLANFILGPAVFGLFLGYVSRFACREQ
jgi:hypothetical protein